MNTQGQKTPCWMRAGRLAVISVLLGAWLCLTAQAQRTATATATVLNGFVAAITVTDGGAGYTVPPAVILAGGGGTGATAAALVSNGTVSQVIVLTAGSGYTSPPEVIVSAPAVLPPLLDLQMVPLLTILGSPGDTNRIEYVNAFGDTNVWFSLTNVVLSSSGREEFYDRISPPGAKRFYRAVLMGAGTVPFPAGFVWLPPGRFTMGSPASEQDRNDWEGPQTAVTIGTGFWMGKYEVTQEEYLDVMGSNPSNFAGDSNRPVERVTWNNATNYCGKLTERERLAGRLPAGWAYRLPTEAEWEYAARAGTTNRFSYGDDAGYTLLGNYAWYSGNSGNTTHAVGGKLPNRWGLYDMYGNVWEWCWDWYGAYPGGSVTDPKGPTSGSYRVIRGGGWYSSARYCRSAYRSGDYPVNGDRDVGFRVVLAPGQ